MLDDYQGMEKKPNGRVQPPVKAGGTENKKTVDSTNKPFGKFNKRREPSGYSNSKSDGLRKPNPPKNTKFSDKRPRPRSQYYSCGKEDSKVADEESPEYGSVFVPGSKKQNLNHLLNFHYAPREVTSSHHREHTRGWVSHPNWLATHKHKYNKEQFLQANCQFIVKDNADYTQHLVNPDLLVDWTSVEQIRLQSGELASCPICLDTPTAAKMTRCGHIYCWSCILHYLALSDKTWRKCPICYEAVHKKDLKSVITRSFRTFNNGDEISFRLMKRERGSLLALPVCQSERKPVAEILSVSETELDTIYSKLLLAKPDEVMSILAMEREELKSQLFENQGCPELCFIEQALELLREREALLKGSMIEADGGDDIAEQMEELAVTDGVEETSDTQVEPTRQRFESGGSEISEVGAESTSSDEEKPNIAVEDLEISGQQSAGHLKPHYFYQAADGQHAYLHALNVKMLVVEHESLEQCPLEIHGRIVEKESGSMQEDLRKRLRYLQHLPLTCQFDVVEIDLTGMVSPDVLHSFRDQIDVRARRRQRRARDERRRERIINEEMNQKWGRYPAPKIRIDSNKHFPSWVGEAQSSGGNLPESPTVSRSQSLSSLCSAPDTSLTDTANQEITSSASLEMSGPSFAQMLRQGSGPGVWGRGKTSTRGALNKKDWPLPQPAEPEVDADGWAAAPQYSQSFSDAIALALEKAEQAHDDEPASLKKKKKKKQKVLFVTGMACSTK